MAIRTAANLKIDRLYHYQSFNDAYLREIIVDGVIHFSRPSDFNDPWDCRPFFDFECLSDPEMVELHIRWYEEITKKHRPDIPPEIIRKRSAAFRRDPAELAKKILEFSDAMASAINQQYRVYCLSPKPDCELMWAHYTGKHSGVCFEFAVRNELFFSALSVQYSKQYPRFLMTGFAGVEENIAPLLSKSEAWAYENEFRLIADEKGDSRETIVTTNGKKAIPSMSLTAVILGCLASEPTITAVKQMVDASAQHPTLKRAIRTPNQYQLQIVSL